MYTASQLALRVPTFCQKSCPSSESAQKTSSGFPASVEAESYLPPPIHPTPVKKSSLFARIAYGIADTVKEVGGYIGAGVGAVGFFVATSPFLPFLFILGASADDKREAVGLALAGLCVGGCLGYHGGKFVAGFGAAPFFIAGKVIDRITGAGGSA